MQNNTKSFLLYFFSIFLLCQNLFAQSKFSNAICTRDFKIGSMAVVLGKIDEIIDISQDKASLGFKNLRKMYPKPTDFFYWFEASFSCLAIKTDSLTTYQVIESSWRTNEKITFPQHTWKIGDLFMIYAVSSHMAEGPFRLKEILKSGHVKFERPDKASGYLYEDYKDFVSYAIKVAVYSRLQSVGNFKIDDCIVKKEPFNYEKNESYKIKDIIKGGFILRSSNTGQSMSDNVFWHYSIFKKCN